MAKEWILNSAMNRYKLNFKRNVGATSESIRKCAPNSLEEWQKYYFENVKPKEHIEDLGRKLYVKITEVIQAEVAEINEDDCIEYMYKMVIDRTYDGYTSEIQTIYGQLQQVIGHRLKPAPDEWDSKFNVDFFIQVNKSYIGLQIKPVNKGIQLPEIFKEHNLQKKTHKVFTDKYGGEVFYIFSVKEGDKKRILNEEIIPKIKDEIKRLEKL